MSEHPIPCPFCGGSNIKFWVGSIGPECSVGCDDCNVWMEMSVPWGNMNEQEHDMKCHEELMKAWNRRATNGEEAQGVVE